MRYKFERQATAWSSPPVDDVGYIASSELVLKSDQELTEITSEMMWTRYNGWRNAGNKWRETLGLDDTSGKSIVDFGCGVGIESLQFAENNQVFLADISRENLTLASRVMRLWGFEPAGELLVRDAAPYFDIDSVDIFYANGVVHHLPYDVELLDWVAQILRPGGEVRLMLYSDQGWANHVGEPVPTGRAKDDPRFMSFVRVFDQVGYYADFYNEQRIHERFGHAYDIKALDYICDDGRYLTTTLTPKGKR